MLHHNCDTLACWNCTGVRGKGDELLMTSSRTGWLLLWMHFSPNVVDIYEILQKFLFQRLQMRDYQLFHDLTKYFFTSLKQITILSGSNFPHPDIEASLEGWQHDSACIKQCVLLVTSPIKKRSRPPGWKLLIAVLYVFWQATVTMQANIKITR